MRTEERPAARAYLHRSDLAFRRELKKSLARFAPPPKLTVSEWADKKRYLSPEASAEPGRWNTDRAPYQREMMDALNDPTVEEIVGMTSAQVGKTSIIENILGYIIDQDPGPILLIQPTLEIAHAFSKDRLSNMVRDTPALTELVAEPRAKDASSTILHKVFPGGHITIGGSNSPAGLASRPIRFVICDEVDRFDASAGGEGDPVALAYKRTQTFWNRKRALFSTPTEEGVSRIFAAYEESDQRRYFVPCPHCEAFQTLKWAQVIFGPEDAAGDRRALEAYYECESCHQAIALDTEKGEMLRRGHWRAAKPFKGSAGFHINELYSPWSSLAEMVDGFLKAKQNPQRLRVWINTSLGETFKDGGKSVEIEGLITRRAEYTPQTIPTGAMVLTAGVDVQDAHVEVEVVAWGAEEESWGVQKERIPGDPSHPQVWEQLDQFLDKTFRTEQGVDLKIKKVCIDTGHLAKVVYQYVKKRQQRGFVAIKGFGGYHRALIGRPSKANMAGVQGVVLIPLGVDQAKTQIYSYLGLQEPGPGYAHFPAGSGYDKDHFEQLTSEERVIKYSKGVPTYIWRLKKAGQHNEALDLRVYAYSALALLNVNWVKLAAFNDAKVAAAAEPKPEGEAEQPAEQKPAEPEQKQGGVKGKFSKFKNRGSGGGWANRWRG